MRPPSDSGVLCVQDFLQGRDNALEVIILFKPALVWGAEVSHKDIGKKEPSAIKSSFFGGVWGGGGQFE